MCSCIEQVNADLAKADYNTEVSETIYLDGRPSRIKLATNRVVSSRRKGPINLIPLYCPLCGEKYPDAKTVEGGQRDA